MAAEATPTPGAPTKKSASNRWIPALIIAAILIGVAFVTFNARSRNTANEQVEAPLAPIIGRTGHTTTTLADGRVLVVGGLDARAALDSALILDPATNQWSSAGRMSTARYNHTATRLADGRVLIAGGCCSPGPLDSAEIYNPATRQWSATGSLVHKRIGHAAASMPDGRVLVAGGGDETGLSAAAEIYDPAAGTWRAIASMTVNRSAHHLATIASGKVLAVGGCCFPNAIFTAELYDTSADSWTAVDGASTTGITVGLGTLASGEAVAIVAEQENAGTTTAVRFDPATETWGEPSAPNTQLFRPFPSGVVLEGNRVLVLGITAPSDPADRTDAGNLIAQILDLDTDTWSTGTSLAAPRIGPSLGALPGGDAIASGGTLQFGAPTPVVAPPSAERYRSSDSSWTPTGDMASR
jgi:hypothetical protein